MREFLMLAAFRRNVLAARPLSATLMEVCTGLRLFLIMSPTHSSRSNRQRKRSPGAETKLRIIGGRLRGRELLYNGDPGTRPMKDRTREAIFNLLGPAIRGAHAFDLFAGTGALGLEAISRGAASATLIERHIPTAHTISQNVAALGLEKQTELVTADVFFWARQQQAGFSAYDGRGPWVVFCSPPYSFYDEHQVELLTLLGAMIDVAPADSLFAVEADERFDMVNLPQAGKWDVRTYSPAVVGVARFHLRCRQSFGRFSNRALAGRKMVAISGRTCRHQETDSTCRADFTDPN